MSSYQYSSNSGQHRLQEFVPTYTAKSDYLPTRVVESNQGEANQWVLIHSSSSPPTKGRKDRDTSTPRGPPSSTLIGTSPSRPTRTSRSTSPSPKASSTAESGDTDLRPYASFYLPPLSTPSPPPAAPHSLLHPFSDISCH